MSLIFATQLTAVATLALAVLALLAAVFAGLAFWKQSQEVGLLLRQNENEKAERRRAQASQVSLWENPPDFGGGYIPVHLQNNSPQQLYYPRFGWDLNGRLGDLVLYSGASFMPGDTIDVNLPLSPVPTGPEPVMARPAAVFRDRAGIWWSLRTDGRLDDLSELSPSVIDGLLHPPNAQEVEAAPDAEQ